MDGGRPPLESGEDFRRASMLHGCRVCSSTALLRRSAVPPDGFRQQDFPPFDFACWLRMAERWDVAFIPRALCRYRLHTAEPLLRRRRPARRTPTSSALQTLQARPRRQARPHRGHRRLPGAGPARAPRPRPRPARARAPPDGPRAPVRPHPAGAGRGARIEPALARDTEAWLLLAGSIVGPRAVARIKGRAQPRIVRSTPNASAWRTPISAPRSVASASTPSSERMCGAGRSIVA